MTADQKLKRAVNNALYSLDSVCETDADSFYAAVYAVISAAKKYHKDVVNEEAEAARKKSREWRSKHMQEHPECWELTVLPYPAKPYLLEKWGDKTVEPFTEKLK